MPHQAEILAVGTELLLGNIANTNAQFLSELLASAGIDVLYHTAVGDNPRRLRQAVEIARDYSGETAGNFINGVLNGVKDTLKRSPRGDRAAKE